MERLAVSSWSLHNLLGVTFPHDLDSPAVGPRRETYGQGSAELIELPALVASRGISRLEICSFHLPSRETAYLDELRAALADAGVTLQSLLIESGDLGDPDTAERDAGWISGWVETADALGAEHARILAGAQKPGPETLERVARHMRAIAKRNAGGSTRLATENWQDLLSTPDAVHHLLDATEGAIGLNADFGNWTGPGKYDDLASIFPRAELCHAKAHFADGKMDEQDHGRCIDLAEAAGYTGPYTLIFSADAPDEWAGIAIERDFIRERLAA